jgi:hypothetical protein
MHLSFSSMDQKQSAILLVDIMLKSPRVQMCKEGEADKARQLELDSVEEARCKGPCPVGSLPTRNTRNHTLPQPQYPGEVIQNR